MEPFDVDGNGCVPMEQFAKVLEKLHVDRAAAEDIAESMDLNCDGKIEWSEFVAACIHLGDEDLDDDLRRLFEKADCDGDGLLAQESIANLMASEELRGKEAVRLQPRGNAARLIRSRTDRPGDKGRTQWWRSPGTWGPSRLGIRCGLRCRDRSS